MPQPLYGFQTATYSQIRDLIRSQLKANLADLETDLSKLSGYFNSFNDSIKLSDKNYWNRNIKGLNNEMLTVKDPTTEKLFEIYELCNKIINLITGRMPLQYHLSYTDKEGNYKELITTSLSKEWLAESSSGKSLKLSASKVQAAINNQLKQEDNQYNVLTINDMLKRKNKNKNESIIMARSITEQNMSKFYKSISSSYAYKHSNRKHKKGEGGYFSEVKTRQELLGLEENQSKVSYSQLYRDSIKNLPWWQGADVFNTSVKDLTTGNVKLASKSSLQALSTFLLNLKKIMTTSNGALNINNLTDEVTQNIADTLFETVGQSSEGAIYTAVKNSILQDVDNSLGSMANVTDGGGEL